MYTLHLGGGSFDGVQIYSQGQIVFLPEEGPPKAVATHILVKPTDTTPGLST